MYPPLLDKPVKGVFLVKRVFNYQIRLGALFKASSVS